MLVGLVLTAAIAILGAAVLAGNARERAAEADLTRSFEMMNTLREAEVAVLNQQRAIRNYVLGLEPTPSSLDRYIPQSAYAFRRLGQLAHSDEQRREIRTATEIDLRQNGFWRQIASVRSRQGELAAIRLLERGVGNSMTEDILFITNRIADEERGNLQTIRSTLDSQRRELETYYLIMLVATLATLVLITYLSSQAVKTRALSANAVEREREAEHQRLLINELNHRVKNTLVTVQSLARQTINSALRKAVVPDAYKVVIDDAYKLFEARLFALSAAHNLLTTHQWKGVDLKDMILSTLMPLVDISRLDASGPRVRLDPNAAVTMNLLFHELATNAIKYGALSNEEGSIYLRWHSPEAGLLCFRWEEMDGPPVIEPTTRGFGSKLIEKAAMREIGGTATLSFETSGLVCLIEIPLSSKVALHESSDS